MTIQVADLSLNPPVFLAPLAGITDLPFRNLVQSFGAGLVVSEMVASQEMVQAKPGVREREIEAFRPDEYWSVLAKLQHDGTAFDARLVKFDGKKLDKLTLGDEGSAMAAKKATNVVSLHAGRLLARIFIGSRPSRSSG